MTAPAHTTPPAATPQLLRAARPVSSAPAPRLQLLRWLAEPAGRGGRRIYRVRWAVQVGVSVLCVVLGWQFARFVGAARAGAAELPARPPGVEGFLPISGLMGVLDWIYSGALNTVHPAATILLLIFVAMSALLRKSFCAWICPVGLISEALARVGRRLFGRNFFVWKWLDIPLRGLKYGLLLFFVYAIFGMSAAALRAFIESPYNRVADVKMMLFFSPPGRITLIVVGVLAALSVFVVGAWCRYLCPYGALLGIFSRFSPVKVRRDESTCTDCGMCDRVCMARLPVSKSARVVSAECTGCLDCVASCPVPGTLTVGGPRRRLGPLEFAAAILVLFALGYGAARLTGAWDNAISADEYRQRIQRIDDDAYSHPGV